MTTARSFSVTEKHREARERLSAGIESEIKLLAQQRPARRLVEVLGLLGTWIVGACLVLWSDYAPPAAGIPCLVAGIAAIVLPLNAALLVMHEGMHHNLSKHTALNRLFSVLAGVPIFISFTAYRVIHRLHHRFVGQAGDPDEYTNYTRNPALLWILHYLRLFFGAPLYVPLIPVVAYRRAGSHERLEIVNEYLLLGVMYYFIFANFPIGLLFKIWLGPGIIVMGLTQIRGLAQHGFTDSDDPFLASRNVRVPAWLGFYLLHENFHLEHHLFAEIPSYNLPGLRALLAARLPRETIEPGYISFLLKFFRATVKRDLRPILTSQRVEHTAVK